MSKPLPGPAGNPVKTVFSGQQGEPLEHIPAVVQAVANRFMVAARQKNPTPVGGAVLTTPLGTFRYTKTHGQETLTVKVNLPEPVGGEEAVPVTKGANFWDWLVVDIESVIYARQYPDDSIRTAPIKVIATSKLPGEESATNWPYDPPENSPHLIFAGGGEFTEIGSLVTGAASQFTSLLVDMRGTHPADKIVVSFEAQSLPKTDFPDGGTAISSTPGKKVIGVIRHGVDNPTGTSTFTADLDKHTLYCLGPASDIADQFPDIYATVTAEHENLPALPKMPWQPGIAYDDPDIETILTNPDIYTPPVGAGITVDLIYDKFDTLIAGGSTTPSDDASWWYEDGYTHSPTPQKYWADGPISAGSHGDGNSFALSPPSGGYPGVGVWSVPGAANPQFGPSMESASDYPSYTGYPNSPHIFTSLYPPDITLGVGSIEVGGYMYWGVYMPGDTVTVNSGSGAVSTPPPFESGTPGAVDAYVTRAVWATFLLGPTSPDSVRAQVSAVAYRGTPPWRWSTHEADIEMTGASTGDDEWKYEQWEIADTYPDAGPAVGVIAERLSIDLEMKPLGSLIFHQATAKFEFTSG